MSGMSTYFAGGIAGTACYKLGEDLEDAMKNSFKCSPSDSDDPDESDYGDREKWRYFK